MILFTDRSIRALISFTRTQPPGRFEDGPLTADLVHVDMAADRAFVHRDDNAGSRLTIMSDDAFAHLDGLGSEALSRALERVDRASRELASPPLSLPPTWHKFKYDSSLAFFALPHSLDQESLRWIAQVLPDGDAYFWQLTSAGAEKQLAEVTIDQAPALAAKARWPEAVEQASAIFPEIEPTEGSLQPSVDLDVVGPSAISRGKNFSSWLDELTPAQLEVLHYDQEGGLKVRGPAGTGKTLVLQLKALREIYRAADFGDPLPHVLFLTHSWALAELVDESLRIMDERTLASEAVDVMPLTWVREHLYGPLPEGIEMLGEDSLDGKRRQLGVISHAVDSIAGIDWHTYESGVSEHVAHGVLAEAGSPERIALCWMLMREFAEVIDANRLKPGIAATKEYVDLPRARWMVDLPNRTDREFVFAVFTRFVAILVDEGRITTDQALDDFRRYLESYTWNARRQSDGYDLVLVDEFHLFNDTERYLIHLLTRDASLQPRMILALDPHQSPYALLTGMPEGTVSRQASANLPNAGRLENVDLKVVHRFSGPILAFVELAHSYFPNLVDIGDDWLIDFAAISAVEESTAARPRIRVAGSRADAAAEAVSAALDAKARSEKAERTAIIATGIEELESVRSAIDNRGDDRTSNEFIVMESRDDVERLNYSHRSIVVGTAEFCAGLQFGHVVALAFSDDASLGAAGASIARAKVSEFYLAITRAEKSLTVVTSGDSGVVGTIAKAALDQGVAGEHASLRP